MYSQPKVESGRSYGVGQKGQLSRQDQFANSLPSENEKNPANMVLLILISNGGLGSQ